MPTPRDDRWRRIGEILEAALEQPDDRLDAFLAEACGTDAALEAEVRSLRDSHRAAGAFLEPGRGSLAVPEFTIPAIESLEGRVLGAWRVVRPLGEGGMGTVYLAERGDGQFRQQGALKLIRHGLASEEMIRRFRRERQILASLDHPGIARLLDGGATPEGLPWLVMEYVEGQPLYAWCSDQRLPLAARLRLFLSICAAVQAAHQRLVLHRDIKPGNILITGDGMPRLMDFGVAKIFAAEGEHETQDLRTIALPLTPEYASPEQLRGEEVATASDIYSLGVLLFEMLTGARPYPTRAEGTLEMIRVVLEHDPPRPSTAVGAAAGGAPTPSRHRTLPAPPSGSPQSLRRKLSGDLDNIVLKAMAKEPERRYASVEHLAEDIRRFLDGRPVAARPATWSYRTAKFVRRNRLAVAAAALAVLALAAGLASTSWQASVARRERDVAERRARDIQSLANALLFDVHDSLAALPGSTPVREMVVTKATDFLDSVAADAGPDSATRFGLADAYFRLSGLQGQVWMANVGKAEEAVKSMLKCREIRESLLEEYPDDPRALSGVMMICALIGLHDLEHGRGKEALAMQERALACCRRLIELYPDSTSYKSALPRRLYNVGLALVQYDRLDDGLARMDEGIREMEALARRQPEIPAHRLLIARGSLGYVNALLMRPGNTDQALASTRRATELFEDLARENPSDAEAKRGAGMGYYLAARIFSLRLDRPDSALANGLRSGAIFRELVRADPGNEDFELSLAVQEAMEGQMLGLAGRTDAAEAMLRPLVPRLEAWARRDTNDTRFSATLGETCFGLALVDMNRAREATVGPPRRDRWLAARSWLERVQALDERLSGANRRDHLSVEANERFARCLAACDSALGGSPTRAAEKHPSASP